MKNSLRDLMTQVKTPYGLLVTKIADNSLLLKGQFFMEHWAINILSQLHTTLAITEN